MRHRPQVTNAGWGLAKLLVLIVVFVTLAGFTMLSHFFSNSRAGRIACLANQRAMQEAFMFYQSDSGGNSPDSLEVLRIFFTGPPESFARCPSSSRAPYEYNAESGTFRCPTAGHEPGL